MPSMSKEFYISTKESKGHPKNIYQTNKALLYSEDKVFPASMGKYDTRALKSSTRNMADLAQRSRDFGCFDMVYLMEIVFLYMILLESTQILRAINELL